MDCTAAGVFVLRLVLVLAFGFAAFSFFAAGAFLVVVVLVFGFAVVAFFAAGAFLVVVVFYNSISMVLNAFQWQAYLWGGAAW